MLAETGVGEGLGVLVVLSVVPTGLEGEAADVLTVVTDSATSGLTVGEEDSDTPVGTAGLLVVVGSVVTLDTPVVMVVVGGTTLSVLVVGARAVVLEVSAAGLEVEGA